MSLIQLVSLLPSTNRSLDTCGSGRVGPGHYPAKPEALTLLIVLEPRERPRHRRCLDIVLGNSAERLDCSWCLLSLAGSQLLLSFLLPGPCCCLRGDEFIVGWELRQSDNAPQRRVTESGPGVRSQGEEYPGVFLLVRLPQLAALLVCISR